jgi:hypothetical protein
MLWPLALRRMYRPLAAEAMPDVPRKPTRGAASQVRPCALHALTSRRV